MPNLPESRTLQIHYLNFYYAFESIRFLLVKITKWERLFFRFQSRKQGSYETKEAINLLHVNYLLEAELEGSTPNIKCQIQGTTYFEFSVACLVFKELSSVMSVKHWTHTAALNPAWLLWNECRMSDIVLIMCRLKFHFIER